MILHHETVDISVDAQHIEGTLIGPVLHHDTGPGALFVHGWGGNQDQYLARARIVAALGWTCLTFDLRGHERTRPLREAVTREDNLRDVVAAYDVLARSGRVDGARIAMVGSSYGAYLGAVTTTLRPVRWLALRAPAIYKDAGWGVPKRELHSDPEFAEFRRRTHRASDNRALDACARFRGEALVVESGDDSVVPHAVVTSYVAALADAHSLTYRVIEDADHSLSREPWKQAYCDLLVSWLREMSGSDPPEKLRPVTAAAAQLPERN
jgi:uncharacterized protein